MGCGTSSNQIHEVINPMPQFNQAINCQQQNSISYGKCYFFGQSLGQRKIVCFNTNKYQFVTLSSRIRIPIPTIKLEPIEKLYEQSQEIILPQLMEKKPSPPFNFMFATFCHNGSIFLSGGITYEGDHVSAQSYFYNTNPELTLTNKIRNSTIKTFIKFETTASMNEKRYCHMGISWTEERSRTEFIFVFGGKGASDEPLKSCQKFNIQAKKWITIQPMCSSRAQGCSIIFNQLIYIFGGISDKRSFPQDIEYYDPKNNLWKLLDMKLHRGIRACLVLPGESNSILIFGGNSGEEDYNTVIKVNLLQFTYQWETTMTQSMSNIKSIKHGNKLLILSNQNNIIHQYDMEQKVWKNLPFGYKNYLPTSDLRKFTTVSQPLKIQITMNKECQQKNRKKKITKNSEDIKKLFIFGNENYPCLLSLTQQPSLYSIKLDKVPMSFALKSKMNIIPTNKGYFICGGTNDKQKHSSNQTLLYDPSCSMHQSTKLLSSMCKERYDSGIAYVKYHEEEEKEHVYVFGGAKDKNEILKSVEKYCFKSRKWFRVGQLFQPRSKTVTHVLDEPCKKVMIIGGTDQDGKPSSLIEIYDVCKNQVISSGYFPPLKTSECIRETFIRKLSPNELAQIINSNELQQPQKLYNTQQQFSQKQSPTKYEHLVPLPTKFRPQKKVNKLLTNRTVTQQIQIRPKKKMGSQKIQPIKNNDEESLAFGENGDKGNNTIGEKSKSKEKEKEKEKCKKDISKCSELEMRQFNKIKNSTRKQIGINKCKLAFQKKQQAFTEQIYNQNNNIFPQLDVLSLSKTTGNGNIFLKKSSTKQEISNEQKIQNKSYRQNSNMKVIQDDLQEIQIEKGEFQKLALDQGADESIQLASLSKNDEDSKFVSQQQLMDEQYKNNEKQMTEEPQLDIQNCYGVRLYLYKDEIITNHNVSNQHKQSKSQQRKRPPMQLVITESTKKQQQKKKEKKNEKKITSLAVYDLLINKNNDKIKVYNKNQQGQICLQNKLGYNFAYSIPQDNSEKHCFISFSYRDLNETQISISVITPECDLNTEQLNINTYQIVPSQNENNETDKVPNFTNNKNFKMIENIIKDADLQYFSIAKFY